ncbi:MAG TPA: hypothetical protein VFJ16_26895 [Longimicrobium sp.]|nr:hypothetical protein [Longimicrobium sp.]
MTTLRLEFNCMCVFVPEPNGGGDGTRGKMHVLMPSTKNHQHGGPPEDPVPAEDPGPVGGHGGVMGHGSAGYHDPVSGTDAAVGLVERGETEEDDAPADLGAADDHGSAEAHGAADGDGQPHAHGPEVHVVRVLHPSLDKDHPRGLSMEGWALTLGKGDDALLALGPDKGGERVVNLSDVASQLLPHRLVEDQFNNEVNARVTLLSGELESLSAEAHWKIQGTDLFMAFRAVWKMEIENPTAPLQWTPLDATVAKPVTSLSELAPESDGSYRISIYHVPDRVLPPDPQDNGQLFFDEIQNHFRALYVLFGIEDPRKELLPEPPHPFGTGHCGLGQVRLGG